MPQPSERQKPHDDDTAVLVNRFPDFVADVLRGDRAVLG